MEQIKITEADYTILIKSNNTHILENLDILHEPIRFEITIISLEPIGN